MIGTLIWQLWVVSHLLGIHGFQQFSQVPLFCYTFLTVRLIWFDILNICVIYLNVKNFLKASRQVHVLQFHSFKILGYCTTCPHEDTKCRTISSHLSKFPDNCHVGVQCLGGTRHDLVRVTTPVCGDRRAASGYRSYYLESSELHMCTYFLTETILDMSHHVSPYHRYKCG